MAIFRPSMPPRKPRRKQAEELERSSQANARSRHAPSARTKTPDGKDDDHPDSTGSGVVIDEKGDILTNLHVIHSTDRWVVTFSDGSKSDAEVVNVQPENDLAVITRQEPARRSQARDPGLHRAASIPATRWWRWAFPSASARRFRPAWWRA